MSPRHDLHPPKPRRRPPLGRWGAVAGLSVAVLLAPSSSRAAGKERAPVRKSPAAELKEQADRAMDALHYDDALAGYQKAYELTKDPALLYNQARAYQALGDYVSALDYLDRFEADAPTALQARVPDLKGLHDDLRGKVGVLALTCDAVGAEVVLRDKVVGTTPLRPLRTTAGHATLVIHGDAFRDYRTEIDVVGGRTVSIEATLTPKDVRSVLLVRSVAGAHVSIDGSLRGDVPIELVIDPGLHAIHVEREGYEPTDTSAVLGPVTRKELDVPLVKRTPIVARWWFWTAVGAAVAGGVATYFVVTTERSPDRGTISPGVLSTPSGASVHF